MFASESVQVPQVSHAEGLSDSAALCTQQVMLAQVHRAALIHGSAESPAGHPIAVIIRLKGNVSVLSSKAFTATENSFWRFLRQFDILNKKIRMSILLKSDVISQFGLCFSGLSWLIFPSVTC